MRAGGSVREREPRRRIAAGALDPAEPGGDVGRQRHGAVAGLEAGDGRPAVGHDHARVQDTMGIEGVLHPAEEGDDAGAVDPLEEGRPQAAVAVLARGRAAQLSHRFFHMQIQFIRSRSFLEDELQDIRSIFRLKIERCNREMNFLMILLYRLEDMLLKR